MTFLEGMINCVSKENLQRITYSSGKLKQVKISIFGK